MDSRLAPAPVLVAGTRSSEPGPRSATSSAADARRALRELREALEPAPGDELLLFCSAEHRVGWLEEGVDECFHDVQVHGCTTAGEIGHDGYTQRSVSALLLPARDYTVHTIPFEDLSSFRVGAAATAVDDLLARLQIEGRPARPENCFGLLLVDGLTPHEEIVSFALGDRLADLPLIGAAAADSMRNECCYVLEGGSFKPNAGVLLVVHTERPFRTFRTQDFEPTEERVAATAVDPARRLLLELDGQPAAHRYAEVLGVPIEELATEHFVRHPLMLRAGGEWFARSIQRSRSAGALVTRCAIEEGLVLRVGTPRPLVATATDALQRAASELPELKACLVFESAERRLQLELAGELGSASELARRYGMLGFHTFGEKWGRLHLNQSMTGVCFG